MDVVVNALPLIPRMSRRNRWSLFGAIVAALALIIGTSVLPAGAAAVGGGSGTVKVDGDDVGGPGNAPHEACGLQVSFYGFDPGNHTVVVTWTSKDTGNPVVTTPASGAANPYTIVGGVGLTATLPFALHTAGLQFHAGQGYHVTLDVSVDGVGKSKTIYVGACSTDVGLSKSASPSTVLVGDTFSYTLTVTNNGPLNGVGFQVTDSLPAGFTLTSITAPLWDCVGADVDCTYKPSSPPLSIGGTTSFIVTGTANAAAVPTMTNTAYLNPNDTDLTNNVAQATVTASVPLTSATAVAPGPMVASSCSAGTITKSHYTVPTTTGVSYLVDGVATASGTVVYGTAPDTDTITAVALSGYVLSNPAFSATMTFLADAAACAPATAVAPDPVVASTCSQGTITHSHYTVPTTTGVGYLVDGVATASGTVVYGTAPDTDTITAVALAGYTLSNPAFSATMTFLADHAACTPATAVTPTVAASSCLNGDALPSSYTVPSTTGVVYKVNGSTVAGGTVRSGTAPATETLTAVAEAGYELTNPAFSVTMTFLADAVGCTPTADVTKTNDANGDEVFHADEEASSPSAPVTFKLHVTNTSPYAIDVSSLVTDAINVGTQESAPVSVSCLPALVLAVGESGDCFFTMDSYSPADGLTKTDQATVSLTRHINLESLRRIAAVVAAPQFTAVSGLSTVKTKVPVRVTPPATASDLSMLKTGPATITPGSTVAYTLAVTNIGNATATSGQVTDNLPAGLTFVSASGAGFTCTGTTNVVCDLVGSLAPGASATVNLVTTLASTYASTTLSNVAVVGPPDATPANNTSTAVTAVTLPGPAPDENLGVSKTGPGSAKPGDELVYTIDVTNVKGTPATGFTVTDVLPIGLAYSLATGTDFACGIAGQTITCTYNGTLAAGQKATIAVRALLDSTFTGKTIANTAVVDPRRGDTDATDNSSTATTTVVPLPLSGGGGGGAQAPSPSPSPAAGGGGGAAGLPFTGSNSAGLLQGGLTLLVLGIFMALVARRRRTASE
jgi:uncharacterized repeat protein (TIGR01451 family)